MVMDLNGVNYLNLENIYFALKSISNRPGNQEFKIWTAKV